MKLSVVTVCYNSANTIGYTLDSFFSQRHAEKELVVVDGSSTDGTLDIVRSFPKDNIVLISEPDRGMYDAMNKGLKHFGGEAVGFLNSDDIFVNESALSDIAMTLESTDMVHGNLEYVRQHASDLIVRRWIGSAFRQGAFRRGWMPPHPTFYVRRHVVESVGLFDLCYSVASDYDWMLRACELKNFRIQFLDRTLVRMMIGGRSTRGPLSIVRHNVEALRARRAWLNSGLVDYAFFAKPLRKVAQFMP